MRLAAVGVGIGLVLALALAQVLSSLLIGVSGYDVTTFLLVPTLLAAVRCWRVICRRDARRKSIHWWRSGTNEVIAIANSDYTDFNL